jgi:hypothetical protein
MPDRSRKEYSGYSDYFKLRQCQIRPVLNDGGSLSYRIALRDDAGGHGTPPLLTTGAITAI